MSDHTGLRVQPLSAPNHRLGDGLHRFRIEFGDGKGSCFITAGEALRLRELNTDWVQRALTNLKELRGAEWLKRTARTSSGLQLHYTDAHESWSCASRQEESDAWPT